MNNQKSKTVTDWKYVLIVTLMASLMGGIILGYQWLYRKEAEIIQNPEIKILKETPKIEEKNITIFLDKDQYYTSENLGVTVQNNSDKEISANYSSAIDFYLEWQKYEDGEWKMVNKNPALLYSYCDGILPKKSEQNAVNPYYDALIDSESSESKDIFFTAGRYRLVFYYWENNFCRGEAEKIFSKEFILSEKNEIATNFCQNKERLPADSSFFNFDKDAEKEVLVICGKSGDPEPLYPFVLKKQNGGYKIIWEFDPRSKSFYYRSVTKPEIIDIDGDVIDELYFRGYTWGGTCTYSVETKFLYSPKYDELFSFSTKEEASEKCDSTITSTSSSSNLDLEKYKTFKNFLLQK